MRISTFAFTGLALVTGAPAQMVNNTICPDFTTTDINGNVYNLYAYLDQGYTVYFDLMTTWCPGSWYYHDSHTLAALYDSLGPGTPEHRVMVFMVECDENTHLPQLLGNGNNTIGDWVAGTPYPILDDHTVGDLLQADMIPDLLVVCPDRRAHALPYAPTMQQLLEPLSYCPQAVLPHDAALLPFTEPVSPMEGDPDIDKVCPGDDVLLHARLSNIGTSPLTAASVQASINGNVVASTDWTGNMATYEFTDVGLLMYTPTVSTDVVYTITTPDDDPTNNTAVNSMAVGDLVLPSTEVTMQITTDDIATGTTWWLLDVWGNVIYERPNGSLYSANTTYLYDWTLQNGQCYIFRIIDYNGDGLCCDGGNGSFSFSANGETHLQDPDFGFQGYYPFTVNTGVAVPEVLSDGTLLLYPNPASDLVRVSLPGSLSLPADLVLIDALGREVLRRKATSPTFGFDVGDLDNGRYLMHARSASGSAWQVMEVLR